MLARSFTKLLRADFPRLLNSPSASIAACLAFTDAQRRNFSGNFKSRVGDLLDDWTTTFMKNDIFEPRESIENILMHVLKAKKYSDVYKIKNKDLSLTEVEEINKLANMRLSRMPVQYVIGEWDFRDVNLIMRKPVFIPRPETEQLVDYVLKEVEENKKASEVLEFCCGSGAISLALLKAKSDLHVIALDKSSEACELTKENAERNKLSSRLVVVQGTVGSDNMINLLNGKKFHVIVANPPYIPTNEIKNLQPDIQFFEDHGAMDGGEDGLTIIKLVIKTASELLHYGGKLFLETDPSYPQLVKDWLKQNESLQLHVVNIHPDLCGVFRFTEIVKKNVP